MRSPALVGTGSHHRRVCSRVARLRHATQSRRQWGASGGLVPRTSRRRTLVGMGKRIAAISAIGSRGSGRKGPLSDIQRSHQRPPYLRHLHRVLEIVERAERHPQSRLLRTEEDCALWRVRLHDDSMSWPSTRTIQKAFA
jgi:hypothetical protein